MISICSFASLIWPSNGANFSSAAMTALGLSNINAVVPMVVMKDPVTKDRRHVCADESMTILVFDARVDAAAAIAEDGIICSVRPRIDGKFGLKALHSLRAEAIITMENDALVVTDTMLLMMFCIQVVKGKG